MNTKEDPGPFTGKAVQESGITSACSFWSVCISPLGDKKIFFFSFREGRIFKLNTKI